MTEQETKKIETEAIQRGWHPADAKYAVLRAIARRYGVSGEDAYAQLCALVSWFKAWAAEHALTRRLVNKDLT